MGCCATPGVSRRLDMAGRSEDAAGSRTEGARMRYKLGAEQLEQVPSRAPRRYGVVRSARTALVGSTHAMDATTGAACGVTVHRLDVVDQLDQQAR